jgi:alpha-D-ribose 1-methylphosphonate 5-triphosphate synthase subunit PhnL
MTILTVKDLTKSFTLHHQSDAKIIALWGVNFSLEAGSCLVLRGPSGAGKSSLLRTIYGNYIAASGEIYIHHKGERVELCDASPRTILNIRKNTMGYVSQFLRVVPRVTTLQIVANPLLERGIGEEEALEKSRSILTRLNIPERLWMLAPATFSGGEQQRVNIAHGFISDHPLLLLDEPTASLDEANRDVVIEMINEKRAQGVAILGIFHDSVVREAVADDYYDLTMGDDTSD